MAPTPERVHRVGTVLVSAAKVVYAEREAMTDQVVRDISTWAGEVLAEVHYGRYPAAARALERLDILAGRLPRLGDPIDPDLEQGR